MFDDWEIALEKIESRLSLIAIAAGNDEDFALDRSKAIHELANDTAMEIYQFRKRLGLID